MNETFDEIKARLGRNPWVKLKVYKPGTWLSRGGWITVRKAEKEIANELEYLAARRIQQEAVNALRKFFPAMHLNDGVQVVIE